MKHIPLLSQEHFPSDHSYVRSSTSVFKTLLEKHEWFDTFYLKNGVEFWRREEIFGAFFARYIFERTEEEPDIHWLKRKYGWWHGKVIWIPIRRKIIPSWWKASSYSPHFSEMGLTYLDESYLKKWDTKVRWSRRTHFFEQGGTIKQVSNQDYFTYFCEFPDYYPYKNFSIQQYHGMATYAGENLRNYIAFLWDIPVAWLSALDYGNEKKSTFHFLVFTRKEFYSSQSGTALVDVWFQESLRLWVKYIDFDRLMKPWGPKTQVWYTVFKHHFIDVHFHFDAYEKWF